MKTELAKLNEYRFDWKFSGSTRYTGTKNILARNLPEALRLLTERMGLSWVFDTRKRHKASPASLSIHATYGGTPIEGALYRLL